MAPSLLREISTQMALFYLDLNSYFPFLKNDKTVLKSSVFEANTKFIASPVSSISQIKLTKHTANSGDLSHGMHKP